MLSENSAQHIQSKQRVYPRIKYRLIAVIPNHSTNFLLLLITLPLTQSTSLIKLTLAIFLTFTATLRATSILHDKLTDSTFGSRASDSFTVIEDPRTGNHKKYHFGEVIFMSVTVILCGTQAKIAKTLP